MTVFTFLKTKPVAEAIKLLGKVSGNSELVVAHKDGVTVFSSESAMSYVLVSNPSILVADGADGFECSVGAFSDLLASSRECSVSVGDKVVATANGVDVEIGSPLRCMDTVPLACGDGLTLPNKSEFTVFKKGDLKSLLDIFRHRDVSGFTKHEVYSAVVLVRLDNGRSMLYSVAPNVLAGITNGGLKADIERAAVLPLGFIRSVSAGGDVLMRYTEDTITTIVEKSEGVSVVHIFNGVRPPLARFSSVVADIVSSDKYTALDVPVPQLCSVLSTMDKVAGDKGAAVFVKYSNEGGLGMAVLGKGDIVASVDPVQCLPKFDGDELSAIVDADLMRRCVEFVGRDGGNVRIGFGGDHVAFSRDEDQLSDEFKFCFMSYVVV